MNRDDIIKLALEAGIKNDCDGIWCEADQLIAFAALVAAAERKRLEATAWGASKKWIVEAVAAEREACAKVCEDMGRGHGSAFAEFDCVAAIRARGEK